MRLLGIDLGTKRVGVAITDELGFGAYPVATFLRGRARADDLATILRHAEQQQAEAIVMGLPLHADGTKGEWAQRVETFTKALSEATRLPVILHNEYLSSQEANEDLIAAGVKAKRRQQVIDQAAAVRILESYLRAQKGLG